jgi:osmotically-inducible protein OsmY
MNTHDVNMKDEYAEAELQRCLAEGEDVSEQGIEITRHNGIVVVRGEVESPARRDAILRCVGENFPDKEVRSEIVLIPVGAPAEPEDVS